MREAVQFPLVPAAVTNVRPEVAAKRLKPWEPVDTSFNGCSEGFCGTRGKNARAVIQPAAKVGDYTYCIVSGAVFQIKESHFHTDVNGKTVYFCCEGCARYFEANRLTPFGIYCIAAGLICTLIFAI